MSKIMRAAFILSVVAMVTSGLAWAQPDCAAGPGWLGYKMTTWALPMPPGGSINITSPVTFNQCVGCCAYITITGLPAGWSITGSVEGQYVFTRACVDNAFCDDGMTACTSNADCMGIGSGRCNNRVPVETYEATPVSASGDPIVLEVCTPPPGDWNSFEIHIENQFLVRDATGAIVRGVGVGGNIAPGTGWDQTCRRAGCTPGFWKNHLEDWPMGISPSDNYCDTFGLIGSACPDFGMTLDDAVNARGNRNCEALIRHSVAALLNATTYVDAFSPCLGFTYSYTPAQVITMVQGAFSPTGDCDAVKDLFVFANEQLCGLADPPIWWGILPGSGGPVCMDGSFGISCNPTWTSP